MMAGRGRAGQARSRSNSAARAPTSSSTTATWRRRPRPRPTASSTTPARTAARAAESWCSATSTTSSWSCSSPPSRASWSAIPASTRQRDGAAGVEVALRHGCVLRARRRARSRSAGPRPTGPGYWFPPTVLTPARTDRTVTEEIFGPVVTVLPFEDEADAHRAGQRQPYGLSGSIWTENVAGDAGVARRSNPATCR